MISPQLPPIPQCVTDEPLNRRQWLIASAFGACATQIAFFDSPLFGQDTLEPGSRAVKSTPDEADDNQPLEERFVFHDEKQKPRETLGKVLVEAVDGSLLIQGIDSRIWRVSAQRLKSRTPTKKAFAPISKPDLGQQLVQELGAGFRTHITEHYVLCTNASEAYARWCGGLFERLETAFQSYWNHRDRGFKTVAPQFPLVALIFQQQSQFAEFATVDVGPDVASVPGYFSILTNRIVLYDLAFDKRGQAAKSAAEIEQRLGAVIYNVATMIHEATHQIAFNCGLHTRLADNPLWLTEGMATYFETPDLKSKTGWKTAGLLNKNRLQRFKEFLSKRREPDSLTRLIRNDERLTNPETAEDAYAESWALTYFLIRKKPSAYVEYLTFLASKKPLDYPTPEERVEQFVKIFGNVRTLDAEFIKYIKPLRLSP